MALSYKKAKGAAVQRLCRAIVKSFFDLKLRRLMLGSVFHRGRG